MKITTLDVAGFRPALTAMRHPFESYARSDSVWHDTSDTYPDEPFHTVIDFVVGKADRDLSERLAKAGPEHAKHLRMIMVWADIAAPLYWWKQMDCYRFGVEKVSCSTMHRLTARELTSDDFEEDDDSVGNGYMAENVEALNTFLKNYRLCRENGNKAEALRWWRALIRQLPQSYIQKRTVMFSYAALRNIYRQRAGHKLHEWRSFLDWVETLPESWMITGKSVPGTEENG